MTLLIAVCALVAYALVAAAIVVKFLADDIVYYWRLSVDYNDDHKRDALGHILPRAAFWPLAYGFTFISWSIYELAYRLATRTYGGTYQGRRRAA